MNHCVNRFATNSTNICLTAFSSHFCHILSRSKDSCTNFVLFRSHENIQSFKRLWLEYCAHFNFVHELASTRLQYALQLFHLFGIEQYCRCLSSFISCPPAEGRLRINLDQSGAECLPNILIFASIRNTHSQAGIQGREHRHNCPSTVQQTVRRSDTAQHFMQHP